MTGCHFVIMWITSAVFERENELTEDILRLRTNMSIILANMDHNCGHVLIYYLDLKNLSGIMNSCWRVDAYYKTVKMTVALCSSSTIRYRATCFQGNLRLPSHINLYWLVEHSRRVCISSVASVGNRFLLYFIQTRRHREAIYHMLYLLATKKTKSCVIDRTFCLSMPESLESYSGFLKKKNSF